MAITESITEKLDGGHLIRKSLEQILAENEYLQTEEILLNGRTKTLRNVLETAKAHNGQNENITILNSKYQGVFLNQIGNDFNDAMNLSNVASFENLQQFLYRKPEREPEIRPKFIASSDIKSRSFVGAGTGELMCNYLTKLAAENPRPITTPDELKNRKSSRKTIGSSFGEFVRGDGGDKVVGDSGKSY